MLRPVTTRTIDPPARPALESGEGGSGGSLDADGGGGERADGLGYRPLGHEDHLADDLAEHVHRERHGDPHREAVRERGGRALAGE